MKDKKSLIATICILVVLFSIVATTIIVKTKQWEPEQKTTVTNPVTEESVTMLLSKVLEDSYHSTELREKQIIGRVVSEDLDINCNLVYGTSDEALWLGAGLHKCSSLPGLKTPQNKTATCPIIAGHCQIDFKGLEAIDPATTDLPEGVTITLEMPYGNYVYEVKKVEIIKASDFNFADYRANFGNFTPDYAIFYTCYPFGQVGYVKQDRMFLYCKLIDGIEVVDDTQDIPISGSETVANIS